MLERHIAVNLPASHIDAAEAIAGLHAASSENFSERLTRFVNVMLGSSEFALYLLRGHEHETAARERAKTSRNLFIRFQAGFERAFDGLRLRYHALL